MAATRERHPDCAEICVREGVAHDRRLPQGLPTPDAQPLLPAWVSPSLPHRAATRACRRRFPS
jgi:hypothetical protein